LRIALVSHSYPTLDRPAQATFIKNEAHLIAEQHITDIYIPSVFALPFQSQFKRTYNPAECQLSVQKIYYLSIPKNRFASITRYFLALALGRALENQPPDVVHLHWLYPSGLAAPELKERGYPVVITIHGGDWNRELNNPTLEKLKRESIIAADKLVCVGKTIQHEVAAEFPELNDKICHIPHGIDTDLFKPPESKNRVKHHLKWHDHTFHLLCIANLYYEKGVDLLIQAFGFLERKKDYHLYIIAPNSDSEEKESIQRLIKKHEIENQVTFYPQQNQKDVVLFLQAADILISPSRNEGFGLVVAEAIACGTPVLATMSGGPEEIVTNQTGKIVPTNDAKALTSGIKEIISSLSQFNPKKLHRYIENNFSLTSKKESLNDLYREVSSYNV